MTPGEHCDEIVRLIDDALRNLPVLETRQSRLDAEVPPALSNLGPAPCSHARRLRRGRLGPRILERRWPAVCEETSILADHRVFNAI
jgi:hypothetical protein